MTLHNLGQLADNQGAVIESLEYYFQALTLNLLANQSNNLLGITETLSSLAALIWTVQDIVDQEMSELDQVRFEDLLEVYVRLLVERVRASDMVAVERIHWVETWDLGDIRGLARQMQERALQLHETIGNRRGQIWTLTDLAIWQRDVGDYESAERYLGEALALAKVVMAPRELYETYLNLGDVHLIKEDIPLAIAAYEAAVTAAESLRVRLLVEMDALSYFDEFNLMAYERLIRLNSQLNPCKALEYLERVKGREFLRRLRWGEMERSSHVSKELLQREMEMIEQLQVAAKILEGMSESDRLMGVENYLGLTH